MNVIYLTRAFDVLCFRKIIGDFIETRTFNITHRRIPFQCNKILLSFSVFLKKSLEIFIESCFFIRSVNIAHTKIK